jgi:hypothetical protein
MRRIGKILLMLGLSAAVLVIALVVVVRFVLFPHPCDRFETVLSKDPQGRSVSYVYQACTTIGTVTEGWVDLAPSHGRTVHLMTFAPWGGEVSDKFGTPVRKPFEPVATWTSPTELRISIGTVGKVIQQRANADGVHVSYDIGMELYK